MKGPSVKRRLAGRVAEAAGVPAERADLVLRAFYEEFLRAAHLRIGGESEGLSIADLGRFTVLPSRRGRRHPVTGADLEPHWAFCFKPSMRLTTRYAQIRKERGI